MSLVSWIEGVERRADHASAGGAHPLRYGSCEAPKEPSKILRDNTERHKQKQSRWSALSFAMKEPWYQEHDAPSIQRCPSVRAPAHWQGRPEAAVS